MFMKSLQVFYWTHMLYVPFWILVILHGPHFWKWFVAPGAMFILEKIFRSKLIKMARYGETFVEEVNLLPSKVSGIAFVFLFIFFFFFFFFVAIVVVCFSSSFFFFLLLLIWKYRLLSLSEIPKDQQIYFEISVV